MRTSTSSASSGAPMSPSAASKDVYVLTVGRCPSARRFSNSHQTSSGSGDSPRPLRLRRMVESFCVAMCTGKQLLPLAHFLHAYGDAPSPSADPVPSIEIGPDDEALDDVAPATSRFIVGSSAAGSTDAARVSMSASVVTESTRVDAPALGSRPIVPTLLTRASGLQGLAPYLLGEIWSDRKYRSVSTTFVHLSAGRPREGSQTPARDGLQGRGVRRGNLTVVGR